MPLRTDYSAMNCSLARALHEVGDPWTLLLLRECLLGVERFEGFAQALGVSRQILSNRLAAMVACGLLERVALSDAAAGDGPPEAPGKRAAYRLTGKAQDLTPALLALMQWGDRWISGAGREPVLPTTAAGEPLAPLRLRSRSGKAVRAQDLRWQAGPGCDARTRAHLREAGQDTVVRRQAKAG